MFWFWFGFLLACFDLRYVGLVLCGYFVLVSCSLLAGLVVGLRC